MEFIIVIILVVFGVIYLSKPNVKFGGNVSKNTESQMKEKAKAFVDELKSNNGLYKVSSEAFLKKGENCYYSEQSTLFETRSVRHYQSGWGGVRVMKGVYIGGTKGRSESEQEWKEICTGEFIVTNKRIIFDGNSENRSYNLDRIIGIRNMVDAVEVSLEGRQKSMVFSTENSLILNTIIRICSTADDPSDLGDDPEIEINFC